MLTAVFSISPSDAQRQRPGVATMPDKPQLGTLGERINANTIAIVSGNINATWLTIAYDLSAVLDRRRRISAILPVIGRGGEQNVRDVRFLKGVDLGITVDPVLTGFRRSSELGNIDDKIVYITKLFDEEMHVLVRDRFRHHLARAAAWQDGQLQRHRQRHATFRRATSSAVSASRSRTSNAGQTDALLKMQDRRDRQRPS